MRILFVICFALLAVNIQAAGANDSLADVLAGIHKKYAGMRDMKGRFTQEAYNRVSKMTLKETGTVYIKRPGLMRWDYQSPQIKQLIVNGRTTWFYVPEDRQVIKGEIEETAFAFLTHNKDLSEDFDGTLGQNDGKLILVELTPRKKMGNIAKIRLSVTPDTRDVRKVVTVDNFNNATTISLSDIQTNINMDARLFTFTTPAGVRVMDTNEKNR